MLPEIGGPGKVDFAYAIVKTGSGYVPVCLEGVTFERAQLADPKGIQSKFVPESRLVALARVNRGMERRTMKTHFGWIAGGKEAWDRG